VTFALGHYCWFKALSLAPASVFAPLIYTQIVAAILLGVVLFQEIPEFQTVFFMAIIISSGFLIFLNRQPIQ
jgi:drug/metabolite transporter (DMT)-like permease